MGNCLKDNKEPQQNAEKRESPPKEPAAHQPPPEAASMKQAFDKQAERKAAKERANQSSDNHCDGVCADSSAAAAEAVRPPQKAATYSTRVLDIEKSYRAAGQAPGGKVFSVSLQEAAHASDPAGLVPYPIRHCCAFLRDHLHHEGIFRCPGSNRIIAQHIKAWDADPYYMLPCDEVPENACSVIVQFLMRLKATPEAPIGIDRRPSTEGLPPAAKYSAVQHMAATKLQAVQRGKKVRKQEGKLWGESPSSTRAFMKALRTITKESCPENSRTPESSEDAARKIRGLLVLMPLTNQATFKVLCALLKAGCEEQYTVTNKMSSDKFGLCVTPGIQW